MSYENPADYLERAAALMALDNGAINRNESYDEVVSKMLSTLKTEYSIEQLAEVEEFLSTLTADELDDLCCGGDDDRIEASPLVNTVLNTMFDNM